MISNAIGRTLEFLRVFGFREFSSKLLALLRGFIVSAVVSVEGIIFVDRGVKLRRRFRHQIRLESAVVLEQFVELNALPSKTPGSGILLQKGTEICSYTTIMSHGGYVKIGRNVHIGPRSQIQGRGGVDIGDGTLIGPQCQIIASNHTRSHDSSETRLYSDETAKGITIGSQCWFGANIVVLDGVTIGNRAIIGASSVVSKNIPDDVIAFGNPARPQKQWDYVGSYWKEVD